MEDPCIASVEVSSKDGVVLVGFSFFRPDAHLIQFVQFKDNSNLPLLESLLLQARPRECIACVPSSPQLWKRLGSILSSANIELLQRDKSFFQDSNLESDLARVCAGKNYWREMRGPVARTVAGLLTESGILLNSAPKIKIKIFLLNAYLRLDTAAFTALSLLPQSAEGRKTSTSLYGHLNKCRTLLGARRLSLWISQPLQDYVKISHRLNIVQFFVDHPSMRSRIHAQHMRKVPDLDQLGGRLKGWEEKKCSKTNGGALEDLVRLYDCVVESQGLAECLAQIECPSATQILTAPLTKTLQSFQPFLQLVQYSVDLQEAKNGNYCISRNFSSALAELATAKDALRAEMEEHCAEVEAKLGLRGNKGRGEENVRLVECGALGLAFRVTKKDTPTVQKSKLGFQQVRLNKNEYLFISPQMKRLNEQLEDLDAKYDKEQMQLVDKALKVAASFWPAVEKLAGILSTTDILASFAAVCLSSPHTYTRPNIQANGQVLHLVGSRHALLECQTHLQSYIANDIYMDRNNSRLQIITGPNMGGKSTYIRQVALTAVMAQLGCFVPCQKATLPIFSQIMCRVGASDVQLKGISTFMAEMVEAAAILDTASLDTLVIVDELGRGTSTYEGFGLAWAIARHLVNSVKCFTLFATHFHEMAALEHEVGGVANKHVEVDISNGKLTFLYKVLPGGADQSYGVHVAELANVPAPVIKRAREKAEELEYAERHQLIKPPKRLAIKTQQITHTENQKDEENIKKNEQNIQKNQQNIQKNEENIQKNQDNTQTNQENIQKNQENIQTNDQNINDQNINEENINEENIEKNYQNNNEENNLCETETQLSDVSNYIKRLKTLAHQLFVKPTCEAEFLESATNCAEEIKSLAAF